MLSQFLHIKYRCFRAGYQSKLGVVVLEVISTGLHIRSLGELEGPVRIKRQDKKLQFLFQLLDKIYVRQQLSLQGSQVIGLGQVGHVFDPIDGPAVFKRIISPGPDDGTRCRLLVIVAATGNKEATERNKYDQKVAV